MAEDRAAAGCAWMSHRSLKIGVLHRTVCKLMREQGDRPCCSMSGALLRAHDVSRLSCHSRATH
jgi:hypothetical protein